LAQWIIYQGSFVTMSGRRLFESGEQVAQREWQG